jgi:hypothetical protein
MQVPSAFGFLKIMDVKTQGYRLAPELPFISAQELLYDKCSWLAQLSFRIFHPNRYFCSVAYTIETNLTMK